MCIEWKICIFWSPSVSWDPCGEAKLSYLHYDIREGNAELHILKLTSVIFHLPSVIPRQLSVLVPAKQVHPIKIVISPNRAGQPREINGILAYTYYVHFLWLNFTKLSFKFSFLLFLFSKPLNYAIALNELGADIVHSYVGQEPSGRKFNDLDLDHSSKFWPGDAFVKDNFFWVFKEGISFGIQ